MHARPILIVELPVPAGREDEWNRWYHDVHIPDLLSSGVGAVNSVRYRLAGGDADVTYLVIHEFESGESLERYFASTTVAGRWDEYKRMWGTGQAVRRRAFLPIYEHGDRSPPG